MFFILSSIRIRYTYVSMMKFLIILCAWIGCLLPYLSSSKQQLISHQLSKPLAWSAFTLLQGLAIVGLAKFYGTIAACLIWLMLVTCMWVGLTLLASHLSQRLLLVGTLGVCFFSLVTLCGINYVA